MPCALSMARPPRATLGDARDAQPLQRAPLDPMPPSRQLQYTLLLETATCPCQTSSSRCGWSYTSPPPGPISSFCNFIVLHVFITFLLHTQPSSRMAFRSARRLNISRDHQDPPPPPPPQPSSLRPPCVPPPASWVRPRHRGSTRGPLAPSCRQIQPWHPQTRRRA